MSEIAPHEPHKPFIRVVEYKIGKATTRRYYCTLCQKEIRLVLVEVPSKWVHADEDPGDRRP